MTGPDGARRRVPLATSARDLDPSERARFPGLAAVSAERDRVHLRTIAAQMDAAQALVAARELDLFALRVEALDILTHAHFAEAVQEGQDDGAGLLFDVYRYLDARLGSLHAELDADDRAGRDVGPRDPHGDGARQARALRRDRPRAAGDARPRHAVAARRAARAGAAGGRRDAWPDAG